MGEAAYCDLIGVLADQHLVRLDTPEGLRRAALGGDVVDLVAENSLDYQHVQAMRSLPFVRGSVRLTGDNSVRLVVDGAGTASPALMEWCRDQNIAVKTVEEYTPPFDDVFVELIKQESD
jgi:ABC-2 type transport system ATP-binding protein